MTPTRYYGTSSLLGVVVDGWKYIETSRPELYDLRSDPAENVNLLEREPARADTLARSLVANPGRGRPRSRSGSGVGGPGRGVAPASGRPRLPRRQRGDASSHGFDRSKEDAKDLIAFFRKDQRLNKLVEQKQYPEARALCAEMLRERPGFADCYLQMSKIAAAGGDTEAALAAAQKGGGGRLRRTSARSSSWGLS